jgi:hypothetical protein
MKILVIGSNGNMGQRYCRILEMLGHEWIGDDLTFKEKHWNPEALSSLIHKPYWYEKETDHLYAGAIVATPTHTHVDIVSALVRKGKPVLCEKPFSTEIGEVNMFMETLGIQNPRVRMMNQYEYFLQEDSPVDCRRADTWHAVKTAYNFYKTGNDGLFWDCINIIGLADEKPEIMNDSPIWECRINGWELNPAFMDWAYVWNIKDWLEKFDDNLEYINKSHNKVWNLIND